MARILISWMAINNDFLEDKRKPNPDGPTSLVHKYFYNYDYHLLLSSHKDGNDMAFEFLVNYLQRTYKHNIREEYMNLIDVIDAKTGEVDHHKPV